MFFSERCGLVFFSLLPIHVYGDLMLMDDLTENACFLEKQMEMGFIRCGCEYLSLNSKAILDRSPCSVVALNYIIMGGVLEFLEMVMGSGSRAL